MAKMKRLRSIFIVEARTRQYMKWREHPRGGVRYEWTNVLDEAAQFRRKAEALDVVDDERIDNFAVVELLPGGIFFELA